ncbi:hypothetical protein MRX96_052362, partial [Rhipicephalus microplus]
MQDLDDLGRDDFMRDEIPDCSGGSNPKRRRLSDASQSNGLVQVKQEPDDECSYDAAAGGSSLDGSGFADTNVPCISFQNFQEHTWLPLHDRTLQPLQPVVFRADADKGFNFSAADEAHVCQKKNHFQVTVHVQAFGDPAYVKVPDGRLQKIDAFYLHFFGVKRESPSQTIKVEQSQADRTKKPFYPLPVDLSNNQAVKHTIGRLHFSETTSNNMRKKGKPNPDQRYFYLVVSLCAHCGDAVYTIAAQSSQKIIVRGPVGINTERTDEKLVVNGNILLSGHLIQPSDERAKSDVVELDTREQLKNVANMRIYRYRYIPEYVEHAGLKDATDTGVLAQEVKQILPDAVHDGGDVLLGNGDCIEGFLVVNKERIFMENVGAVKELCKVTDSLGTRIDELEKMNRALNKIKRVDSVRSCSSSNSTVISRSSFPSRRNALRGKKKNEKPFCSNKLVQGTITILILVMAF